MLKAEPQASALRLEIFSQFAMERPSLHICNVSCGDLPQFYSVYCNLPYLAPGLVRDSTGTEFAKEGFRTNGGNHIVRFARRN
jgi:hypothetical protein